MKLPKLGFKSLRSKLIVSLISICVVPMAALGATSYLESKALLRNKLESSSSQMLREVNRGIDKELTAIGNNVSMIASNYNAINIESNPEFLPYLMDSLKGIKDNNPDIESVYMGTVTKDYYVYPEDGMGKDYDPTTRPWFKKAMESKGKVVFTDPYKDIATGKMSVSIARTVEKDGQVIGVISMDIDFSRLSKSTSEIKVGDHGYAVLLDTNGTLLTHPDEKLVGTDTFAKLPVWNEAKTKGEGFSEYIHEGKEEFAVYTKSPVSGWTVLGTMEASELSDDSGVILRTLVIFLLAASAVGILLSLIVTKSLAVNIKKIKDVMSKASQGDLTEVVHIKSSDEIGTLAKDFNAMVDSISHILKSVEGSSKTMLETASNLTAMTEETTASISEVSRAINEISQGAVEQASGTREAANEMENLSEGLGEISSSTSRMDEVSSSTKDLSNKGLQIVKFLMDKSEETKKTTDAVSDIVEDMSKSTEKISLISDAINQITSQTNLLSLNASIEAARAGEAGRGFAVVADEIRKLADQSQASTEEIKKIVEVIQGKSISAVHAMEKAKNIVTEQDRTVEETTKIFNEIYVSIGSLIDMVNNVKGKVANINEQKESVAGQLENISSISEEAASSSEEVSASVEEITTTMDEFNRYVMGLQELSEKLNEELGRFRIR